MSKRPMTALILSTYRLVTANGCSWIDDARCHWPGLLSRTRTTQCLSDR